MKQEVQLHSYRFQSRKRFISIQGRTSVGMRKLRFLKKFAPMNPCTETFECHMLDLHFFSKLTVIKAI